jgi:hypothetical protein
MKERDPRVALLAYLHGQSASAQRVVLYRTEFAEITGSTDAALFLSQLYYWSNRQKIAKRGWFFNSAKEWTLQTGLTRRQLDTARGLLEKLELISVTRRPKPLSLLYRVNHPRILELLEAKKLEAECTETPIECTETGIEEAEMCNEMAGSCIGSGEFAPSNGDVVQVTKTPETISKDSPIDFPKEHNRECRLQTSEGADAALAARDVGFDSGFVQGQQLKTKAAKQRDNRGTQVIQHLRSVKGDDAVQAAMIEFAKLRSSGEEIEDHIKWLWRKFSMEGDPHSIVEMIPADTARFRLKTVKLKELNGDA